MNYSHVCAFELKTKCCERRRRNYILLEKELPGDDEEEMVFTASGSPLHPTHNVTSVCL